MRAAGKAYEMPLSLVYRAQSGPEAEKMEKRTGYEQHPSNDRGACTQAGVVRDAKVAARDGRDGDLFCPSFRTAETAL